MRGTVLLALLALAACSEPKGTIAYFNETESDAAPFKTRMLVTPEFLRIDYGVDNDDFILFDRKQPTIYSVNNADKTVVVIERQPVSLAQPKRFEHRTERDNAAFPDIDGHKTVRYRLVTNGKQCYEVFSADGLLPDVTHALREYHETIAGEHARALTNMPKDLQDDCDMANFVFAPARHLEHGFPVRSRDAIGNSRQLTDYKEAAKIDPALFKLPPGYRRYRPGEMPGQSS